MPPPGLASPLFTADGRVAGPTSSLGPPQGLFDGPTVAAFGCGLLVGRVWCCWRTDCFFFPTPCSRPPLMAEAEILGTEAELQHLFDRSEWVLSAVVCMCALVV